MLSEPKEFQCFICGAWVLKENYDDHMKIHPDPVIINGGMFDKPMTLVEMQRRFSPLGYYSER